MPKQTKIRTLRYTLMAPVGPGELRKSGSALSLILSIPYFFVSEVIPPIFVINDVLQKGIVDAGMSGGCRWKPFQLKEEEYGDLVSKLKKKKFAEITPPGWVRTHHDWQIWCREITWGIPALEYKRRWEEISSCDNRREKLGEKSPEESIALFCQVNDLSICLQRWMKEHRSSTPKLPPFRPSRMKEYLT